MGRKITRITNELQLRIIMTEAFEQVTEYVVNEIMERNRDLIERLVYSAYTPAEYERTNEFKDAWTTEVTSGMNVIHGEMSYDSSKLTSVPGTGQHSSIPYGDDSVREYLADIIYNGLAGAIYQPGYAKHSPMFKGQPWTKKRNVWRYLKNWLDEPRFRKIFEKGMTRAGIPWTTGTGKPFVNWNV